MAKVTFGFYGTQEKGINSALIEAEIKNMKKIKDGLDQAAIGANATPPNYVVSVLFVPNWKAEQTYTSDDYKLEKEKYMTAVKQKLTAEFGADFGSKVIFQDFYEEGLPSTEKQFMHNLQALGSNADMIKNRAIINNAGEPHLQLDSNTKISSYDQLYKTTFGQKKDALNASYYDEEYVSAHNKIVYTHPNDQFAAALKAKHEAFCDTNKDNVPIKSTNCIYSKVFAATVHKLGWSRETKVLRPAEVKTGTSTVQDEKSSEAPEQISSMVEKTVYPVHLENTTTYRLTPHVVTAVNGSWKEETTEEKIAKEELKKVTSVPVQVGDAICDNAAIINIIKKYNGKLSEQAEEYDYKDPSKTEENHEAHDQLMQLSNLEMDYAILNTFMENNSSQLISLLEQTLPQSLKGATLNSTIEKIKVEMELAQQKISEKGSEATTTTTEHKSEKSVPVNPSIILKEELNEITGRTLDSKQVSASATLTGKY